MIFSMSFVICIFRTKTSTKKQTNLPKIRQTYQKFSNKLIPAGLAGLAIYNSAKTSSNIIFQKKTKKHLTCKIGHVTHDM